MIWTGCKSGHFRNTPGTRIIKDGLYWVPMIADYTGARREEIAGLQPSDIKDENGIPYFDIAENHNRGVKTLAGVRRIPIHDRLSWLIRAQKVAQGVFNDQSLAPGDQCHQRPDACRHAVALCGIPIRRAMGGGKEVEDVGSPRRVSIKERHIQRLYLQIDCGHRRPPFRKASQVHGSLKADGFLSDLEKGWAEVSVMCST
jgi:hypothetical protein